MSVSFAQFAQVLALIHEAGTSPERWHEALAAIVHLAQSARGAVMDIDATGALLAIDHFNHDPAHARAYAEYYYAIDPTREVALATPALQAAVTHEHFPKRLRDTHEYFDFARRIDIGDVIGTATPVALGRRSLFSLQRAVGAAEWTEEEKRLFELLAAHVALAKRVQWRLGEAWAEKAELEAAFGKLALPAFVLDREGHIRHLNGAGHALLARSGTMGCRGGRLRFADPKLGAAVHAAVRNAAREHGRSAALPVHFGRESGEILVTTLPARHGAAAAWQVPVALLVVAAGPEDERAIAWRLQELYRLTPTESRIAAALAVGRTVDEIARARRLTEATLRTHLRSIFGKTGTRRQAELVRLALRGAILNPQEK